MARSTGPNQDPPLTVERSEEGRELLEWSRTMPAHRVPLEQWLLIRRLARRRLVAA